MAYLESWWILYWGSPETSPKITPLRKQIKTIKTKDSVHVLALSLSPSSMPTTSPSSFLRCFSKGPSFPSITCFLSPYSSAGSLVLSLWLSKGPRQPYLGLTLSHISKGPRQLHLGSLLLLILPLLSLALHFIVPSFSQHTLKITWTRIVKSFLYEVKNQEPKMSLT